MRKYDTSAITTTVAAPVKSGTFVHLQAAYQEALNALAQCLIGPTPQADKVYILYGCVNTGTYPTYNISAGAVYYNGEIFLVDATNITVVSPHVLVGAIATTYFTDQSADPVTFRDTTTHNIHQIRKVGLFESGDPSADLGDIANFLNTTIPLIIDLQPTLGANYTVKFVEDKAVFFASATVNCAIGFDFTNAFPGCVVRLQWVWAAGLTLTVNAGAGANAYQEGGDITRAAGHTNSMYFTYLGKDGAGNNIVGYSISQIA